MLGDHRHVVAFAPCLQLLDGRRAERVTGREHDRVALVPEATRELANGRGLAGAVHTDHQDYVGAVRLVDRERLLDRGEDFDDSLPQAALQRLDIVEFLAREPLLQVGDDTLRRIDADIGHHEQALEFFERIFINLAAGREIRKVVSQPAVALVDARAQALDESLFLLGFFLFPKHTVTILQRGQGTDGQTQAKR